MWMGDGDGDVSAVWFIVHFDVVSMNVDGHFDI